MRANQIIIIDADELSRHGIEGLIQKAGRSYTVIGTFPNINECLNNLPSNESAILLLDDRVLGLTNAGTLVHKLQNQLPTLTIIVMSEELDVDYIHQLFNHGVSGFVHRHDEFAERIIQAIDAVQRGEWYLSPKASRILYTGRSPATFIGLNRQDLAVVRLMSQGLTVKEIAKALKTKGAAVYRSRRKLRESLGVQTSEQIIAAAIKKGLIEQ